MLAVREKANFGDEAGLLPRLLGPDWRRLHPSVQARFAHEPDRPILYEGVMENVHCSRAGWLFAQLTRLIGNRLTPHRSRDVSMQVLITRREGGGVWWQRTYGFARPFTVISAKRENARDQLCEYVGFGMRLRVYARDGALHFVSERYFWEIAGLQIPLSHWLSPGETHATYTDLAAETFASPSPWIIVSSAASFTRPASSIRDLKLPYVAELTLKAPCLCPHRSAI